MVAPFWFDTICYVSFLTFDLVPFMYTDSILFIVVQSRALRSAFILYLFHFVSAGQSLLAPVTALAVICVLLVSFHLVTKSVLYYIPFTAFVHYDVSFVISCVSNVICYQCCYCTIDVALILLYRQCIFAITTYIVQSLIP